MLFNKPLFFDVITIKAEHIMNSALYCQDLLFYWSLAGAAGAG